MLSGGGSNLKRRAACDECRTKKLKCTGDQPSCSRCVREGIECIYSPQKPMGRPKKRQRADGDEDVTVVGSSRNRSQLEGPSWVPSSISGEGLGMDSLAGDIFNTEANPVTFTSNGSLQPWPQQMTWPGLESLGQLQLHLGKNAVPALTPDSSSHSPPLPNLPPELQSSHAYEPQNIPEPDASTSVLPEPNIGNNLTGMGPLMPCTSSFVPSCACLSTMYLTLNTLQSMDQAYTFPFALHPLREAMQIASVVLDCDVCPKRFITAIQNVHLLGTILLSIAERFSKVLTALSTESARAENAHEGKKFRLADLNTSTSHLHAGGLGCVAAFSINLSPEEWRAMCKKVVRAEVYGPVDGNDCCPCFMGICDKMRKRQELWHQSPCPDDFPRDRDGRMIGPPRLVIGEDGEEKKDHLCMKLVEFAEGLVKVFDWS